MQIAIEGRGIRAKPMRLFLYADEPIVSEALSNIFSQTEGIELARTLESLDQIVPEVRSVKPDLLLLTLTPALHLAIVAQLHQTAPDCRIVLWGRSFSQELSHQAMELGVRGILSRTCSTELLIKCLQKVYEGELWFDRQLTADHMTCNRVVLTHRQAQLAQMVAEGCRNKEIAEKLSISEGAVKVYLSHLFEKLGTKDRMELAELVARNVQPSDLHEQIDEAGVELHVLYISGPEPPVSRLTPPILRSSSPELDRLIPRRR